MFLSFTLAMLTIIPGYRAAKKKELGVVIPTKYEGGSLPLNQHDKLETFVSKLPHTTRTLKDLLKAQIAITAPGPLLNLLEGLLNYILGTVSNEQLVALFTAPDSAKDVAVFASAAA